MKRRRPAFLFALGLIFLLTAHVSQAQNGSGKSSRPDDEALTLYRNARIYTNDPGSPWAQAMLVRGEEILAIGDEDEVSALADKNAEVVDLGGHFVMPGFNDAHLHLGGAGADLIAVRLNGAASVEELQKRLAEAVAQHKEGEWITGGGWDHTLWPDKKFPNRQELDAVAIWEFLVRPEGVIPSAAGNKFPNRDSIEFLAIWEFLVRPR